MLFSSQLPLKNLVQFCQVLRHNLSAGLSLVDVFRQQSERGQVTVRPVARRVLEKLEGGDSLEDSLKHVKDKFPPLFISLSGVGERSGNLPDIFKELERYYALQLRLRRQLISQSILPILQLVGAVFVIALMLLILGIVSDSASGQSPIDPFGVGTNVSGALTFLGICFGTAFTLFAVYIAVTRLLKQKPLVDATLLRVPVLGPCLEALALTRFCLALRLTMETGMSIVSALRLSMRATANSAYISRTDAVLDSLRRGNQLTESIEAAHIFPHEFENIMAAAEQGGRVPEAMRHQAEQYEELSVMRMTMLTRMLGFLIWATVAILLIIAIFRIFTSAYGAAGVPI